MPTLPSIKAKKLFLAYRKHGLSKTRAKRFCHYLAALLSRDPKNKALCDSLKAL